MNNDLISREALKKAIKEKLGIYIDGTLNNRLLFDIIDKTPTVEVDEMTQDLINKVNVNIGLAKPIKDERPQGEWVVQRLQSGFDDVYCPYCNARPTRSEYGYYLRDNFCHECGADMRKGDDKNV